MPRGDRTGPNGMGPMTGRGLGNCAGYSTPGYTKGPGMGLGRGWGRGRGRGYGRGMAWGRGYGWRAPGYAPYSAPIPTYSAPAAPITEEQQLNMLKQEKEYLESEMNGMQQAIEDLSKRISELEQK
ncbi:MAG: hypothetical protein GF317_08295 [Candidatus Lokiarchaeota archaeon]|nr:hypothetical protein [Candidatus Lokiarchaeota archaeon]MBD3199711.1 hypothetical protein [Candidatus Lokiarchaeota archaeon]